jgi:hypothetical protein
MDTGMARNPHNNDYCTPGNTKDMGHARLRVSFCWGKGDSNPDAQEFLYNTWIIEKTSKGIPLSCCF